MFTIAAPSMMLTGTLGLGEFNFPVKEPGLNTSAGLTWCQPMCDNDGEHAWFSCSKNSSIFPSHICDAMYSLEKREQGEQSFFRDDQLGLGFFFDWSMSTIIDGSNQVFIPYVHTITATACQQSGCRISSLKAETRSKRGKGVRRRVEACNVIPGNWQEFLTIHTITATACQQMSCGMNIQSEVEPCNAIPGNWQEFLRIDDNKAELFSYLAICVSP